MLHPKLILLTNNWVWNSPVFGAVARMADFYPVANGAENSVELLADRVKNGYSVVIFPEGTRSVDGSIKRFHKGAFYLAEQLNLDILPIVLHGTGYTMTKGDFLLKDGTITVKFLPRIKPDDTGYGVGYSERTKNISSYFKDEFKQLSIETERPRYFKEQLLYNYLYKGPLLEWRLRIKLWREKNYLLFHQLLPRAGKILDVGCGYGYRPYLLHFASKERQFIAIDADEDKIEMAANCFSRDKKINFIFADALKFPFENYDAIILANALQHMQPADRKQLIEKCIRHLNPGGTIILKDNHMDLNSPHKQLSSAESFPTTNSFTFNNSNYFSSHLVKDIAAAHNMKYTEVAQKIYRSETVIEIKHERRD